MNQPITMGRLEEATAHLAQLEQCKIGMVFK